MADLQNQIDDALNSLSSAELMLRLALRRLSSATDVVRGIEAKIESLPSKKERRKPAARRKSRASR